MCLHWKYVTVLSAEGKADFTSVPLNNTDVPINKSVDCDKGQRTSHNQWRFVMKLRILVEFENVVGYPNNSYTTIISVSGIDKSECYHKAHQRCMDIADEIERDQSGLCLKPSYFWLEEKWE